MRTEERWQNNYLSKLMKRVFPPRIVADLERIPFPTDLKAPGSIYIHGAVDTGKTILAAHMLLTISKPAYMLNEVRKYAFVCVPDLLAEIRDCYNTTSEHTEQQIVDKYVEIDYLILDDLGSEKPTSWALATLYLIVNRRYENLKTTIITSNLDLEELAEQLNDDRIPSRIERMCKILEMENDKNQYRLEL